MKLHCYRCMARPVFLVCLLLCAGQGYAFNGPGAAAPALPVKASLARAAVIFNVRDYGAQGNAQGNDAPAINKAIDAASMAGGGTVYFPAGTYLSGSIHLKSHITLYLDQGATLQAIFDTTAYDAAEPFNGPEYQDFGHSHWHNGFIWGENLEDIAIMGTGLIYGKGLTRNHSEDHLPKLGLGDKSIALKNCRNVIFRDFSILHGGHFGILATGVDNLTIDNLKIDTNRDGIDIDCCKNVRVSNCSVNSPWDDGICPKSTYALGYARTTENVTITNCMVSGFQEGTLLDGTFKPMDPKENDRPIGRIKLGTESNGGFRNITISNCVFDHCRGLALETVDGAELEDVTISNITMHNVNNAPIFLRLGSRMRGPAGVAVGKLRRINIGDIVVYDANPKQSCIISGIPGHPIEGLNLHDIRLVYPGGGAADDESIHPPEKENGYPEPSMFGALPAYGFYIRHVKDLTMANVQIGYEKEDQRPAIVLDDVQKGRFRFIDAAHPATQSVFLMRDVKDISVFQSEGLKDGHTEQAAMKKW